MTLTTSRPTRARSALLTLPRIAGVVGAVLVQLQAEGWATRWEPAATFGGASLAGRLYLGDTPT